jgi:hypothetical protein
MFQLTAAHIIALSVSCIFFGLAFATFVLCIKSLCSIPFRSFTRVRTALLFVSCATIVIGALSIAQALRRVLRAFVYINGGTTPVEELNDPQDLSNWIHVRRCMILPRITMLIRFLVDHLSDPSFSWGQCFGIPSLGHVSEKIYMVFQVYRTWVVNNYNWCFIVFPIILIIGDTCTGFGIAYAMSRTKTLGYLHPSVTPWTTAFVAISLTLNIICTGKCHPLYISAFISTLAIVSPDHDTDLKSYATDSHKQQGSVRVRLTNERGTAGNH